MGAGTIGCFIGGSLAAAGVRVRLRRPPARAARLLRGTASRSPISTARERHVPPDALQLAEQVPAGIRPALVLLTVKSGATAEAAAELAAALPAGTPVLSLQNGVSNAAVASEAAPTLHVLPGMVPYNVAEIGARRLPSRHGRPARGAGRSRRCGPGLAVFERAGVPIDLHADMLSIQWGKLLLNLNNPVNALSGLPLRESCSTAATAAASRR